MNKKILGVKIGTVISVLVCFAAAILFWLVVKYAETDPTQTLAAFARTLG